MCFCNSAGVWSPPLKSLSVLVCFSPCEYSWFEVYHLHFKVILMQLDPDVCYRSLEESGRPQHQHQLQVSWKCPLDDKISCRFIFKSLSVCIYTFIWRVSSRCLGELTAILDREALTELHLSFRRSMMMMKPMLAASILETGHSEDVNWTAPLDWCSFIQPSSLLIYFVTSLRINESLEETAMATETMFCSPHGIVIKH